VTFDVSAVARATEALAEIPYKNAVEALLQKPPSRLPKRKFRAPVEQSEAPEQFQPVEACSRYQGKLVENVCLHPVIATLNLAFSDHRPLVLSPDMIWLLIAQGFANHVNANSNELRSNFVQHSGQAKITVRRDDFIKGSLENPWEEVFGEFSSQIRQHIGESAHDLLLPRFSTTGTVERAAAEVILLDAMKSYFSFEMLTLCGIPQITLEGTSDDWESLAERTRQMGRFGLEWWTRVLDPILSEFVLAARERANTKFWKCIYKLAGGSGGPYVTGWINAFFPYLKDYDTGLARVPNRRLKEGGKRLEELLGPPEKSDPHGFPNAPTTDAFPAGIASAPFKWDYLGRIFEMEFLSGFVGVKQDIETLGLRPEIGWGVREKVVA
jgi:hypothetical protein